MNKLSETECNDLLDDFTELAEKYEFEYTTIEWFGKHYVVIDFNTIEEREK